MAETVLVVEDEPLIRLGIVSMLGDRGFDTFEAANADEAIRKLQDHPEIGIVLTDVDMPGTMDGVKLAHYVHRRWPPVLLIVISGKVRPTTDELPEGARFIGKPYEETHLLGVISEMTGNRPEHLS
jgi:CheY-like chemotaxis protein